MPNWQWQSHRLLAEDEAAECCRARRAHRHAERRPYRSAATTFELSGFSPRSAASRAAPLANSASLSSATGAVAASFATCGKCRAIPGSIASSFDHDWESAIRMMVAASGTGSALMAMPGPLCGAISLLSIAAPSASQAFGSAASFQASTMTNPEPARISCPGSSVGRPAASRPISPTRSAAEGRPAVTTRCGSVGSPASTASRPSMVIGAKEPAATLVVADARNASSMAPSAAIAERVVLVCLFYDRGPAGPP